MRSLVQIQVGPLSPEPLCCRRGFRLSTRKRHNVAGSLRPHSVRTRSPRHDTSRRVAAASSRPSKRCPYVSNVVLAWPSLLWITFGWSPWAISIAAPRNATISRASSALSLEPSATRPRSDPPSPQNEDGPTETAISHHRGQVGGGRPTSRLRRGDSQCPALGAGCSPIAAAAGNAGSGFA